MNHIITISREYGSGGRTVGKKVAEQLGIPCYDSKLIQKIAEESGFAENYVKEAGEYTTGGFLSSALSNRAFGPTNEDILWEIQCRVISELAEKGPCVIVGRCADYILQDKAKCLKVFIHADMAFRAKRIVEVYGEREQSPEQRLRDKDKRRAAYHRFYTNMKWGYAQNYHITLDSGELGIDKCADIIADLYKSKALMVKKRGREAAASLLFSYSSFARPGMFTPMPLTSTPSSAGMRRYLRPLMTRASII